MATGIFIVSDLNGAARERVLEIQRWADPKLATATAPHVTLTGSSGVGPIPVKTPVDELRAALEPIASSTPPIVTRFDAPHRYMQTNYIVLPLDPHGPLRTLHERIARSGLHFTRSRFPFSPHVTLNFYQTLDRDTQRRLLALRVDEPVVLERIQCVVTFDQLAARQVLELKLYGDA